MVDKWVENAQKRITHRNWDYAISLWECIHFQNSSEGAAPEHNIAELPSVAMEARELEAGSEKECSHEISGLDAGILAEAIFLTHKAAHVMGASLLHVNNGMRTWSLSGCYHSAFFAMHAILRYWGIALPEFGRKSVLVDVRPHPRKLTSRERRIGFQPPKQTLFYKCTNLAHHEAWWQFFLRLLRVSKIDDNIWPSCCVSTLSQLSEKDFAKQRNAIHYRINHWLHPDLHECNVDADFGKYASCLEDGEPLGEPEVGDFSVILAIVLVHLAEKLLDSVAEANSRIKGEHRLLVNWLDQPFNKLFKVTRKEGLFEI